MDVGRFVPTINWKNCWKPKSKDMAISSRALRQFKEGSETKDTTVNLKHPTLSRVKI